MKEDGRINGSTGGFNMMSLYEWRGEMRERSRRRMVARLKFPEHDETEERLLTVQMLRDWGLFEEDELQEMKCAPPGIGAYDARAS
jgi:hypothetical protein